MHAAFKVKDEVTFLKEAAKIVEATQVHTATYSAFEKHDSHRRKVLAACNCLKVVGHCCRLSRGASTTSCTRKQEEIQAVLP